MRARFKTGVLATVVCLLMAALLTGCAGTSGGATGGLSPTVAAPPSTTPSPAVSPTATSPAVISTPSPPTSPATISPPTPSLTATAPAPSQTVSAGGSGTLNLADTGPITLDPAVAAEVSSAMYIVQIFSGLVRLDANLQVAPDIASSWDRSADGRTYTFHLRQDVKFHDGRQVKAADFKYSWERALNPAAGSLTASTYLNDIVGAADILSGRATALSGVKVIDDYTLQVSISTPVAYFLDKMAYPTAFVVDQNNVKSGGEWWRRPNGTGPFKLQQWQPDQLVVLARNDGYYGSKANLSQVQFHLFSGDPLQLYQQGKIDVSPVGPAYMGLATDPSNPISQELEVFPELSLYYIGFNALTPPFDDANVRQAFCYAVDKARVISLSADDIVAAANGILPPGMPGYNSNLKGLAFDPQKAKQLIAASRYGDVSKLPPIVLTTSGWGGDLSGLVGGVIEEWRRNLGIEVSVRQLEPEVFLYSLHTEKNNMWDQGWVADYPDPQDFLDVLFRTGVQNNPGGYSNPQVDALLERASTEPDAAARLKLYQDAEQQIVQDAPVLPLYFGRNYSLIKPYVKNYELSPLGFPLLVQVSIQK